MKTMYPLAYYLPLLALTIFSPLILAIALETLFPTAFTEPDSDLALGLGVYIGIPIIMIVGSALFLLTRKSPDAKFLSLFVFVGPAILVCATEIFSSNLF